MKNYLLIIGLAISALLTLLHSQPIIADQNAYFDNLSIEHGLSQGTVFDIEQDTQGYLWIGTNNGLNRYDGVKFVYFGSIYDDPKSPAALSHSSVYDISPDKDGNFWIGTHYGLNFFDTERYQTKHFLHDPQNPDSLGNNMVRKIIYDAEGILWLATYGGLDRYDPQTSRFQHYRNPPGSLCSNILRTLMLDREGYIWAGSNENGLCRFNPANGTFLPVDYRNNPIESASIGIRDLYEDYDGTVWIASALGLYHYNPASGESTIYRTDPNTTDSLPNDWVQKILHYDNEHFWLGTANGISFFNKKTKSFVNFTPSSNNKHSLSKGETLSMMIDRSGLLWIGSNGGGLDKYNPRQTAFGYIGANGRPGYSLSDPAVWEIVSAYGYVWISTTSGLNRYDINSKKIKHYFPNPHDENAIVSDNIYSITTGLNRDLWLGTQQGLSHFYIDSERFENFRHEVDNPNSLPFNNIMGTMLDSENNLWMSFFGAGIGIYDINNRKFSHLRHNPEDPNSISHNIAYAMQESGDGYIWISTSNGLNQYDPKKKLFTRFPDHNNPYSPINNEIPTLRIAENGNILAGTPIGLAIYNPQTKTSKIYNKKSGLEDEYIYAIEEDKQHFLWVSTNRGLSRINPETDEIKNFDIMDGLQGYEFNSNASFNDGKYLYFGGFNGLNYFIPEEVEISNYVPPVIITHFKTTKSEMNRLAGRQTIPLSYQENFFSVEFAVMDFTHAKRNQYAYKLEGFDKNWIYSGNRNFAAYTNLDGGSYTLHVKGANKYGVWNEAGTSLHIEIQAPPWRRGWAYALYVTTVLVIIFFIIRFRIVSDARSLADKLRRMSTSLSQTLDLETVQNQLANHLQQIAPYQQIIILIQGQECFFRTLIQNGRTHEVPLNEEELSHILEFTSKSHHPVLLNNPEKFEQLKISPHHWHNVHLLIFPLPARNKTLGAVILFNQKSTSFREEQINIAFTLCTQAGTSIDNAQLFEETKQLAFYDPLTGLANRRLFKERLEQMLKGIHRSNQGLAVMLLDLDQFKRVNDSLGHHIGDQYLKEAATRLKQCVRAQDTVARIGGDEFTILLSDVDGFKAATTVAKKILSTFSAPINNNNHSIKLSTSIGISLAPRDSMDSNTLIKNADVALYKAKDSGRNNYQFFTEEMNIKATQHIRMESDLRHALITNEFAIYYQPLVNLDNNQIEYIEALLRWKHPQKGLLLPADFINTAEYTGMINTIGEYVLKSVLEFAKTLQSAAIDKKRILINLSPKQILENHWHRTIADLLKSYELDADWLGLEMTENTLIETTDETINALHEIKNAAITLAIDDFGTGYSSLSYIRKLPIHILKIDRSFIQDIPHDNEDTEITTAIIAMAHKLKLKVVAEGVETEKQLDFLKKNKCDMAQGFYFHRPMPEETMLMLLKQKNTIAPYSTT